MTAKGRGFGRHGGTGHPVVLLRKGQSTCATKATKGPMIWPRKSPFPTSMNQKASAHEEYVCLGVYPGVCAINPFRRIPATSRKPIGIRAARAGLEISDSPYLFPISAIFTRCSIQKIK